MTVSVTRGRSASVCGPPSASSRRTCGPSPRSIATSVGCAGSSDELGVTRSAATSLRVGNFSVRLGGVLCCDDALRSGPSGARIAVGGGVGRTQHVDRVGVAVGAVWCSAG